MSEKPNPNGIDQTNDTLATRVRHLGRVEDLFHRARAQDAGAREAFLRKECGTDGALLETLLRMVRHDEGGRTDLVRPLGRLAADLSEPRDRAGERIGHYRLIERIRYGGMAEVYRAARDDGEFTHDVALKIVRTDRAHARLAERFARERDLLARLRHPNICQIFDGGTTEQGEPYMVMERIEGATFLDACQRAPRDWHRATALFLDLCAGVAHAHRQLIVHRDIKPDNILVALPDADGNGNGNGTVKLLDFGIASALIEETHSDPPDADDSWFSPEFAAPEVAAGGTRGVAADIYSLGILLSRLIEHFPAGRGREIACIAAHATADEPMARYASVDRLAEDLRRVRDRQPISLMAGHTGYVARRFLQRHAVMVGIVAMATTLLVGGLGREMQLRRAAQTATSEAEAERDKARTVTDFMVDIYEAANPDLNGGHEPSLHDLLGRQVAALERTEGMEPETHADLLHALGQAQASLGQIDDAERTLALAIDHLEGIDQTGSPIWARVQIARAGLLRRQGDIESAESVLNAVEGSESSWGGEDRAPDIASTLHSTWASLEQVERRLDSAETHIQRALELRQGSSNNGTDTIGLLSTLGAIQSAQGRMRPALATFKEAHDHHQESGASPNLASLVILGWLGITHDRLGEPDAAEPYLRAAITEAEQLFPITNTKLADTYNNLGAMYLVNGRFADAEPWLYKAKTTFEAIDATASRTYQTLLNNLGHLALGRDDVAAARPLLEASLAARLERFGPEHPSTASALGVLALMHLAEGNHTLALRQAARSVAILRDARATESFRLPITLLYAAHAHAVLGHVADAESIMAEAEGLLEAHHGDNPRVLSATHFQRGQILRRLERPEAAAGAYRAAINAFDQTGSAGHPRRARCLLRLAEIAVEAGYLPAAREHLAVARPVLERELLPDGPTRRTLTELEKQLGGS